MISITYDALLNWMFFPEKKQTFTTSFEKVFFFRLNFRYAESPQHASRGKPIAIKMRNIIF